MNKHSDFMSSVGSAIKGIGHGFGGRNFRIMLICAAIAAFCAYYLPLSSYERYIVGTLIASVLAAELFNSSIEELADVLIQEHHPGIARVKEMSAAATLILSLAAAIIGALIFIPHLGR